MKIVKYLFLILILAVLFQVSIHPVLAASCSNVKPDSAPNLFQIDITKTTAKLYFTPVNNAVTGYTIIYGLERLRNDYGVSFPFSKYEGVINFTINDLSPNTKYYFRVRADNGCRQGFYSETMSVQTNWDFKTYTREKGSSGLEETSSKSTSYPPSLLKEETPETVTSGKPIVTPGDILAAEKDINIEEVKGVSSNNNLLDFFISIFSKIKSFFLR